MKHTNGLPVLCLFRIDSFRAARSVASSSAVNTGMFRNGLCEVLLLALLFLSAGCASFKNPGPSKPPAFTDQELDTKLALSIGVIEPTSDDFVYMADGVMRDISIQMARDESERLVRILTQCQLFDSVALTPANDDRVDILLRALPRKVERTDYDSPWVLLYGGVLPSYSKQERGVCFRFVRGGSGDVIFKWTEEIVIGLVAPFVSGGSDNWEPNRASSTYWHDLRAEMIKVFSPLVPSANETAGHAVEKDSSGSQ